MAAAVLYAQKRSSYPCKNRVIQILYWNIHGARHKKHAMGSGAPHATPHSGHRAYPLAGETGCAQLEPFQHSSDMRRMESGVRRDQRRLPGVGDILAGP